MDAPKRGRWTPEETDRRVCAHCLGGAGARAQEKFHRAYTGTPELSFALWVHLRCRRAYFRTQPGSFKTHVRIMLAQVEKRRAGGT